MAWIEDPLRKKQEEDAQGAQGGAPVVQGLAPVDSGGGAQAPAAPASGAAPSRWANFQQVFNANQGGAQKSADAMAGKIQGQGQAAADALGTVQGQFNNGLNPGAPKPAGAMPAQPWMRQAQPAQQGPWPGLGAVFGGKAQPVAGQPAQAALKPMAAVQQRPQVGSINPNAPPSLEQQAAATYKGKDSLADEPGYADAVGKAQAATQAANASAAVGGRQALLQQQLGPNGYTRGQSRLDSALIGGVGGDRFRDLKSQFAGLGQKVTDATAASQVQAGQRRTDIAAGAAAAQGQLNARGGAAPTASGPQNTPYDALGPRPGHPDGSYVYKDPQTGESKLVDYPTSNHVFAEGADPIWGTLTNTVIPLLAGAVATPAAGAAVAAALAANQAWQSNTAKEQHAQWDKWAAEAEYQWNKDHPNGPPYGGITWEQLQAQGAAKKGA